jgi:GntR family transcriptional regulator, vanillate catabolism transcriptional regulator
MSDSESPRPSTADATSQTERVILQLREMVLRGDFRPGERLAELTLVPRLQASRTPVRLALDRLAHEGLLEALPTGGFRIREFAIADIWDAIEVRGVLEGTAARLAAERLSSPDDLRALQRLRHDMDALQPSVPAHVARYLQLDEAFHTELWRLAKSPMLARTIEGAIGLTFAASGAFGGAPSDAAGGHLPVIAVEYRRAIVEAIEQREGTRAEGLSREYARTARRHLTRVVQNQDLFRQMPGASLIRMPGMGQSFR